MHHIIIHHVKQGWLDDPTLHRPPDGLKVQVVVTVLSCDDLLADPEGCKELVHLWTQAVFLQGPDEAAVVYCVVGLPQAEED